MLRVFVYKQISSVKVSSTPMTSSGGYFKSCKSEITRSYTFISLQKLRRQKENGMTGCQEDIDRRYNSSCGIRNGLNVILL